MNSPDRPGILQRTALTCIVGTALGTLALVISRPSLAVWVVGPTVLVASALGIVRVLDRRRLAELRKVATAYAAGDIAQRTTFAGSDQIARLGGELNALGDALGSTRAALDAQRRMLDGAIGSLAEGVACIDHGDRVLYANPAWRHLAAAGGEAVGSPYYEHLPAAALAAAVTNVHTSNRSEAVEFEHRRRLLSGTVTRLDADSLVVVLHDLTELKRLENARRDFVSAISHELKTPLTAIAGFAETLLDGTLREDPDAAYSFVEKIARHSDRLTVLVRDVLTLSRLEQGGWQVKPATVDVSELTTQLSEEHQATATAREVRLVGHCPPGLVATTDRELLHQLLGNLLSNAIRYNRPGGSVTLTCASEGDRLRLRVSDTGIGIQPEHQGRIFERFYRIDTHRSRASGGTGLGLAIVKQITDSLQGTIAVTSGAEGTTFTVDLPRTDPRAPRG